MECPRCKNIFPKFKEVLIMVDRSFYCDHCWSRLISYPDGESGWRIEEDCTGEKCRKLRETSLAAQ
jgi:hypothetical protein